MKSGLPEVHFKGFILQSQSAVPNISMTKFKKTIRFPVSYPPVADLSPLIFAIHSTSLRPKFSPLAGENSGFPEGGGGDPAATNCSSKYFNDQIQKKQSVLISPIPGADRSLLIFASSQPCSSSVIPVRKGYSNLLIISIIYTIKLFYPHK
jgi:hypothetical protein